MFYQEKNFSEIPVVEIVDNIIFKAIEKSASDIHFESMENYLKVRLRIDGILYDCDQLDSNLISKVISRIKVLANIDIAQKRIPQDGKFILNLNNNAIDLRVSTFPTIYGEKVVIRILDRIKTNISLENLGFSNEMLEKFKRLIGKSSGFILVTGPTGSGKTTTLYSALKVVNSSEKNIITLEDPVEYHIDGVTQGQINIGSGFTFASGIRSLLRQDPDIAFIGEIRDKESAKIAIEASLTGHLVFSTLHTNDSPGAIMRLMDMAIEPFLINAAITGVLAQRLARKICLNCKIKKTPDKDQISFIKSLELNIENLYEGKGCHDCQFLGYKGRIGIFELLVMSENLRCLIVKNPSFNAIYEQSLKDGLCLLKYDAQKKVNDGIITLQELVRVLA